MIGKIKGYEGKYWVTKSGRVFSNARRKFLRAAHDKQGYVVVALKKKQYSVHRLVALAFISNPAKLPMVNHKNGVKSDNRVSNLEWVTRQQNAIHAARKGLYSSKISNRDVVKIRKRYSAGRVTQKQLGKEYKVHQTTIHYLITGVNRKHVYR